MKIRTTVYTAVVLAAVFLGGCRRNFDITATNAITSLAQIPATEIRTEAVTVSDSLINTGNSAKVLVSADCPVSGNFFAVNSIYEWMSEELGGTFRNPSNDGKGMMSYYADLYLQDLRENVLPDMHSDMEASKEVAFSKEYETDKVVSYICKGAGYLGGAHGYATYYGQTFRKSDGRRISYDIFLNDKLQQLAELVKAGVEGQYFDTENTLQESLVLDEAEIFPLPTTPPVFMENGILFVYQQYEITAYAAGMPQCFIPYEQIRPYLTQTGISLLDDNGYVVDSQKK
ncbi:MAG: RsiV family protein [Bacteroidales bacterium]|nr:RsiV family protein [Bacteroidales bacterium]